MDIELKDIETAKANTISAPLDHVEDIKYGIDESRNVGTLERRLKSRHIQFLALSGTFMHSTTTVCLFMVLRLV